jgi:dienelactone hydrolase
VIERAVGYGAFEHVLVSESGEPRPTVILYPTIMGRSDLELGFARRLAGAGHAVLVADLYGREHIGKPREECRALMMALLGHRAALGARLLAVLETARAQPEVDAARVAAIGFCFGGLCALDLARGGADVAGAASFHGLLKPPPGPQAERIGARIIVFHGWDDPMAPPAGVEALAAELTQAGADWQLHAFGNVMHGFTNPGANDPERGLRYDERAAARSWASLEAFLEECFAR